jgi:hypothetical protein
MQDEKIAPHEGRELGLVLRGKKPLAVVEYAKDQEQYQRVITVWQSTHLLSAQFLDGAILFTLVHNSHLQTEYLNLVNGVVVPETNEEYQRAMGRLFGYTEEEIQAFIDKKIECNCTNCQGVGRVKKVIEIHVWEDKVKALREHRYFMQPPQVSTALWAECDHIRWIEQSGGWYNI